MVEADPTLFVAEGRGVRVSPPTGSDIEPYRRAVERSARRIGVWNPVNPQDLVHHLGAQSDTHRTFLVSALDPAPDQPLVGVVNVTNVVRGRFQSATMGYNAFDPYAGTGLFREGLRLVVDVALRPSPVGMALHRVEADVRVGNATSAGVLRSLGFRRERTVRRMLWLADGLGGPSAWWDHDAYAVTREEWPAQPHAPHGQPGGVLLVGDVVAPELVVALARELQGVPLVDLPFDAALAVARRSAAPVVWRAGERAEDAVGELLESGVRAACVDRDLVDVGRAGMTPGGTGDALPAPEIITRLALAVRPHLG